MRLASTGAEDDTHRGNSSLCARGVRASLSIASPQRPEMMSLQRACSSFPTHLSFRPHYVESTAIRIQDDPHAPTASGLAFFTPDRACKALGTNRCYRALSRLRPFVSEE